MVQDNVTYLSNIFQVSFGLTTNTLELLIELSQDSFMGNEIGNAHFIRCVCALKIKRHIYYQVESYELRDTI